MAWTLCPDQLLHILTIFRYDNVHVNEIMYPCIDLFQKFVRKHQLSSNMRKQIQAFLSGFSMSGSCSLGCINWQLDPAIFGLERENNFSIEYRWVT